MLTSEQQSFEATSETDQTLTRFEVVFDHWNNFVQCSQHRSQRGTEDPAGTPAPKTGNKLLAYVTQHKLKLGVLCAGVVAILAFVIKKYGSNTQSKA